MGNRASKEKLVTFVSLNIDFNEKDRDERTERLIQYVKSEEPDILCLQEVKDEVLQKLIYPFLKLGYSGTHNKIFNYDASFEKNFYDCVIFSKYDFDEPVHLYFKETLFQRRILHINVSINGHSIVLATIHFDSSFKGDGLNIKREQYKTAKITFDKMLEDNKCDHVILCTDTNIGDEDEKFFITSDESWSDAWTVDGKQVSEFTYDCKNNSYAENFQSRMDRIIFKSNNKKKMALKNYSVIKTGKDGKLFGDHFGISATFSFIN